MWEAIARNQRRSRILMLLMAVLLVGLGTIIGMSVDSKMGGPAGAAIALGLYFIMLLSALLAGDDILLSAAGAHAIQKEDAPRLWNVVEEMTLAAGLPKMPAVYVIDEDNLNAFAVGRRPEKAAVAVTSGLLKRLTRDELQGVVAHEIGHIRNYDTRFLTLAAVMVGSITLLGEVFLRSLRFRGGGRRSSSDSGGGGQAQVIIFLVAILAAILAPLCARLLYFACSRRREYLADASSARFTRYPEGLASALEKISGHAGFTGETSRVVAPMYIVNPLHGFLDIDMFSTHPPTLSRIQVLRSMAGRAGLSDYEAAFKKVQGEKDGSLGRLTLGQTDSLAAREADPEPEPREEMVARAVDAANLTGRINQFLYIPCACGVNIKVPPNFPGDSVACPRCGTLHELPQAKVQAAEPEGGAPAEEKAAAPPLRFERKQAGWESFRCACGQTLQLSPLFSGTHLTCPRCKRQVEIDPGKQDQTQCVSEESLRK